MNANQLLNYITETPASESGLVVQKTITCYDGVELSVQASHGHYCSPRNDRGPWSSVEVMICEIPPNVKLDTKWHDYVNELDNNIAGWVPVEFVREMIGCGFTEAPAPNWLQEKVDRAIAWLRNDIGS